MRNAHTSGEGSKRGNQEQPSEPAIARLSQLSIRSQHMMSTIYLYQRNKHDTKGVCVFLVVRTACGFKHMTKTSVRQIDPTASAVNSSHAAKQTSFICGHESFVTTNELAVRPVVTSFTITEIFTALSSLSGGCTATLKRP